MFVRQGLAFAVAFVGIAAAVLTTGCGSAHRAIPVVSITERDFRIRVPHVLPAGDVRLMVSNKGPVSHELVIVRAARERLPRLADGSTIDEEGLHEQVIATVEPQRPGAQSSVVVHLVRGRYILLCNMAGHAAGGMLTSFRVR